jgi:hypothetical protein
MSYVTLKNNYGHKYLTFKGSMARLILITVSSSTPELRCQVLDENSQHTFELPTWFRRLMSLIARMC